MAQRESVCPECGEPLVYEMRELDRGYAQPAGSGRKVKVAGTGQCPVHGKPEPADGG